MNKILYTLIVSTIPFSALATAASSDDAALTRTIHQCADSECECDLFYTALMQTRAPFFHAQTKPGKIRRQQPKATQISAEQMTNYAQGFIKQNIKALSQSANPATTKAYNNAQAVVTNLCAAVAMEIQKNKLTGVGSTKLDDLLKLALSNNPTLVPEPLDDLINLVDTCINAVFQENNTNIHDIPVEMKKEFLDQRTTDIFKFRDLMQKRHTSQINDQEIQNSVKRTYQSFISRMQGVLTWQWANAELKNLRTSDSPSEPSSYLQPNPESKKMRSKLKFLDKQPKNVKKSKK